MRVKSHLKGWKTPKTPKVHSHYGEEFRQSDLFYDGPVGKAFKYDFIQGKVIYVQETQDESSS